MSQPPNLGPYGTPGQPGAGPGYGAPGYAPGPPVPSGPTGGGNTGVIIAVIAAVAVVVIGGIAAVVLLRGGDDPAPAVAIEAQPEQPVAAEPTPAPAPGAAAADAVDADLEITLTWASQVDLDLEVVTPSGAQTPRGAPPGASIDQAANDGCSSTTASALERARFDQGRAEPGSYVVRVVRRADCGVATAAQPFEVRVLLPSVGVATFQDELEPGASVELFSVRFPSGEVLDLRSDAAAPVAPPATDPGNPPAGDVPDGDWGGDVAWAGLPVEQLPSGLYCRDLYGMYPYWDAVTYWELEGSPSRMDATGDGFPCTTTYPWDEVRDFWGIQIDPTFEEGGDVPDGDWGGDVAWAGLPVEQLPSGLYCRDLYGMYPYWDAVTYWELEGSPSRMDATGDGFPCTTTYPWDEVRDFWGIQIDPTFQEGGDVPG